MECDVSGVLELPVLRLTLVFSSVWSDFVLYIDYQTVYAYDLSDCSSDISVRRILADVF